MQSNMAQYIKALIVIGTLVFIGCESPSMKEETGDFVSKTQDYGEIHPNAPKKTIQWGQLAGDWQCISKDLDLRSGYDEKWYSNKATWRWQYILGGHAVFNEWWQEDTAPNPATPEFFAAGMFIVNPETNEWEAVVINSRPHKIPPKFEAQYENGKIRMHDGTGKWQVTFFDITKNSFEWKYEIRTKSGDWKSISEISAKRKS